MSAEDNAKMIARMYEAFGRGDVVAILDALTDDVDWAADTSSTAARGTEYGTASRRSSRSSTPLGPQCRWTSSRRSRLRPTTTQSSPWCAAGPPRGNTGRSINMNLHHYFKFRGDKVFYYRGTEDTAQTEAALHA